MDLEELVRTLRTEGNDDAHIEAKSALRGFPESVTATLSAFANTPGGGDIVFGLEEGQGFAATGVYDPVQCQQSLATVARNGLSPSIRLTSETGLVDGVTVVVAHIPEADRLLKPVRVKRTGLAYLRQYDGDYPLSEQEEQAFVADRGQPIFDEASVSDATCQDLDQRALADYLSRRRSASPALMGMTDDEVLLRTGVVNQDGCPTTAGLLLLGIYPQQFMANTGIKASLLPAGGSTPTLRALDSAYLTGPIPTMLDDAVAWVGRVTPNAIIGDSVTGAVRDRPTYPALAIRELVANALIHRDYGPHALNASITLQVDDQGLLIANPGGLFGLRTEALGKTRSHLRNARLAELAQYVTTKDGSRVIERLGTGIPAIRSALAEAGMKPPVFLDQGIRFVAQLSRWRPQPTVTGHNQVVMDALLSAHQPLSRRQLVEQTGLTDRQVRYALTKLADQGLVTEQTVRGRTLSYSPVS
jgi:ATP-dependent DNA helicase RecG